MALHYVTLEGALPAAIGAEYVLKPEGWVKAPGLPTPLTFPPQEIHGQLEDDHDGNGVMSQEILSTDDSDTTPNGWYWTLTFYGIPGVAPDPIEFLAPADGQDGVTIDVASITPVVDPTQVTNMLLALNNLSDVASPSTALANLGGISNSQAAAYAQSGGTVALGGIAGATCNWGIVGILGTPTLNQWAAGFSYGQLIFTAASQPVNGYVSIAKWVGNGSLAGAYIGLYNSSGVKIGQTADISGTATNNRGIRVPVSGFTQTPADGIVIAIYTNSTSAAGGPGTPTFTQAYQLGNPLYTLPTTHAMYFDSNAASGLPSSLAFSGGVPAGFSSANSLPPILALD